MRRRFWAFQVKRRVRSVEPSLKAERGLRTTFRTRVRKFSEAEKFQCVDVVLSMRVEGVVKLF